MRKLVYNINGKDYTSYKEAKQAAGGRSLNEFVRLDEVPEELVCTEKQKNRRIKL